MSLNKKREDISFDEIKHYIEYKPASYAKDVFNADTVITYPLSLGSKCFRKKYYYCDVWLFQKISDIFIFIVFIQTKGTKTNGNMSKS